MTQDHSDDSALIDADEVKRLVSALPPKGKELFEDLKSRRTISLYHSDKARSKELVRAYTQNFDEHSKIWLRVDDDNVINSFVHEIGQVYAYMKGYKVIQARGAYTAQQAQMNAMLTTLANNAFIGSIAELQLEQYGIDRSDYKERLKSDFELFLRKAPSPNDPRHLALKNPPSRAMLCSAYVSHLLPLKTDTDRLQALWNEKIKLPEIRKAAKVILAEAKQSEITPERLLYLIRFFVRKLELGNILM